MPSTSRRSVLASVGAIAIGGIAGCSTSESTETPAGSLRFKNDHDVPHSITIRVTGVGSTPGDRPGDVEGEPIVPSSQRTLTASTVVDPGGTQTYEAVFTEPVWYAVKFTVDGQELSEDAGLVTFHPAPSGDERGTFLTGRVYESGTFSWVVTATDNRGPFSQ